MNYNYFAKGQSKGPKQFAMYTPPKVDGSFRPAQVGDYEKRMQTLKDLGVSEDSALYKAMDWRKGALVQRDAAKSSAMQALSGGAAAAAL